MYTLLVEPQIHLLLMDDFPDVKSEATERSFHDVPPAFDALESHEEEDVFAMELLPSGDTVPVSFPSTVCVRLLFTRSGSESIVRSMGTVGIFWRTQSSVPIIILMRYNHDIV